MLFQTCITSSVDIFLNFYTMKANGVQKYLEFHCIDKSVFFDSHTDLEPHEYINDDRVNFSYFLFIFDFQLYCKGKKRLHSFQKSG